MPESMLARSSRTRLPHWADCLGVQALVVSPDVDRRQDGEHPDVVDQLVFGLTVQGAADGRQQARDENHLEQHDSQSMQDARGLVTPSRIHASHRMHCWEIGLACEERSAVRMTTIVSSWSRKTETGRLRTASPTQGSHRSRGLGRPRGPGMLSSWRDTPSGRTPLIIWSGSLTAFGRSTATVPSATIPPSSPDSDCFAAHL